MTANRIHYHGGDHMACTDSHTTGAGSMIKVFPTVNLRRLFVERGVRLGTINYAVGFINADPRNPAGLSYSGTCEWVPKGRAYVKDIHALIH